MGTHGTQEDYKDQIDGVNVNKYAVSESWSKAKDFKKPFDYTLQDSGQTVLIRRLDMGDLLNLGIAEELDFMSKELLSGDAKAPENATAADKDKAAAEALQKAITKADNFGRMDKMVNKVVLAGLIQPKVHEVPRDENARQKGLVYIDSVPFTDRIELFSVIFETEGLSTFREKQEDGVGDVANEPVISVSSDGPVALRSDDS